MSNLKVPYVTRNLKVPYVTTKHGHEYIYGYKHGFKNRYGERTGKGTNYRFSDQTGVRLIIEPMTP